MGVTLSEILTGGAVVTGVYPGSPASDAGLKIGDRIVAIDGRPVANYKDVIGILAVSNPDAIVRIGISRLGWQKSLAAILTAPTAAFQGQPTTALTVPSVPVAPIFGTETPTWTPADIDDQHGYGSS